MLHTITIGASCSPAIVHCPNHTLEGGSWRGSRANSQAEGPQAPAPSWEAGHGWVLQGYVVSSTWVGRPTCYCYQPWSANHHTVQPFASMAPTTQKLPMDTNTYNLWNMMMRGRTHTPGLGRLSPWGPQGNAPWRHVGVCAVSVHAAGVRATTHNAAARGPTCFPCSPAANHRPTPQPHTPLLLAGCVHTQHAGVYTAAPHVTLATCSAAGAAFALLMYPWQPNSCCPPPQGPGDNSTRGGLVQAWRILPPGAGGQRTAQLAAAVASHPGP